MDTIFYVIERNDGYVFIQRYIPSDYGDITFVVLAKFPNPQDASDFAKRIR